MHVNNDALVNQSLPVLVQMGRYKSTHMWLEVVMWWITRVDERLAPSVSAVGVCMSLKSFKNHKEWIEY